MRDSDTVGWLIQERRYVKIVNLGAFFSLITYTDAGIDYEVLVENEDLIIGEDVDQ